MARLYQCRATAREAELACYEAFPTPFPPDPQNPGERSDLKSALNVLSSALYVMQCKFVGGHRGVRRKPGSLKAGAPAAKIDPSRRQNARTDWELVFPELL